MERSDRADMALGDAGQRLTPLHVPQAEAAGPAANHNRAAIPRQARQLLAKVYRSMMKDEYQLDV